MIETMSSDFGPEWFQHIVETSGDLVVAVDGIGNILYVNPAVKGHLGYEPSELIGTTALRLVAVEDQERAAETLLFAATTAGVPSVLPFRLVDVHGESIPYELMAESHMDDERIGASVIFAREARSRALAEETLDALVTGAELDVVLTLLVRMFDRPLWDLEAAVNYEDESGTRRSLHSGLPDVLRGDLAVEGTPWQLASTSGELVELVELASLPQEMRVAAEAEGFQALWVCPVEDPGSRRSAVLVVWNRQALGPVLGQGLVLDRVLRLMRLALSQRHHLRQLEHAATHDSLTKLPNREAFTRLVHDEMDRRAGTELGLIYLDLDGFKPVNDELGHHAGDRVLQILSARMSGVLRPNDVIARLGGDEFGVLCLEVPQMSALIEVAERLDKAVNEPIEYEGQHLSVGVSMGLVLADGRPFAELMQLADRAMYEAKSTDASTWSIAPG